MEPVAFAAQLKTWPCTLNVSDYDVNPGGTVVFLSVVSCNILSINLPAFCTDIDLVEKGTECSIRALIDFEDGVACYEEVGYTEPCATMWVYNGFHTRENCLDTCLPFSLTGEPNNGPAPECQIADCLQCDEEESGPLFQKVAARSRRRSGLLSKIARSCDEILLVQHEVPCNFAVVPNEEPTAAPFVAGTVAPSVPDETLPPASGTSKLGPLTARLYGVVFGVWAVIR